MGKMKKRRGKGDNMWAREINVKDKEKAKRGCMCEGRD